ncbi:MAG: hypothetical protein ACR2NQ_03800 [Thermodesulfobacteriota bacterium]
MKGDTKEKAQKGLALIKEAIVEKISQHPEGIKNADIARYLDIQSDHEGGHRNWLSWFLLGVLVEEGKVEKKDNLYFGRK